MPLISLKDSIIGIDASYYLERLLKPPKEPLLPALGGWPLALEATVKRELDDLQTAGFKPHFVFDGLKYGIEDDPFTSSSASSVAIIKAFELYEADNATEAVKIFKESGLSRVRLY